jgi:NAD(P)H-dependent FMN reductase
MNRVEAHIQFKPGLNIAEGEVTQESVAEFLRKCMRRVPGELRGFVARSRPSRLTNEFASMVTLIGLSGSLRQGSFNSALLRSEPVKH